MKLSEKQVVAVRNAIKKATKDLAMRIAGEALPELDEKNRAVVAQLKASEYGCKREVVTRLISAVVGVDLVPYVMPEYRGRWFGMLAAVVPIVRYDSHSYPVGFPAVAVRNNENSALVCIDGARGDDLGMPRWGELARPATEDEIAAIPLLQLEAVADFVALVEVA